MSGDSSGRTGTLVRGSGQGYASSSIIERRRRILTTARKMIGAEGMAAINMDEISRRADVAKRTLYNAFQTRERMMDMWESRPWDGGPGMGVTFTWKAHDIFVAPSWMPVSHDSDSDSVLFSASDRALQQTLGIWREEAPVAD